MDLNSKINYFLKNGPKESVQKLNAALNEVSMFVKDVTVERFEMETRKIVDGIGRQNPSENVYINKMAANIASKNWKKVDQKKVDNVDVHFEAPDNCNAENLKTDEKENDREPLNCISELPLKLPLERGWRRETYVSSIGRDCRIRGMVCYYAPGSRIKLEDIGQIQSALEKQSSDLNLDNFSFSTRSIVGTFLQPYNSSSDAKYYYTSDDVMSKKLNDYERLNDLRLSKKLKKPNKNVSGGQLITKDSKINQAECFEIEVNNEQDSMVDDNTDTLSDLSYEIPTSGQLEFKLSKVDDSENYFDERGFLYSRNNSKQVRNSYFRCKNSARFGCRARAKACGNNLEKCLLTRQHNHNPRSGKVDKEKFDKKVVKECNENPYSYPREMYTKIRKSMKNEINPLNIPLKGKYDTLIYRHKRKYIPKLPKSVDEFEDLIQDYKEHYFYDHRNLPFYREVWKTKAGESNVVFVSESVLKKLKEMKKDIHMLMDGTFKVLPRHIKFRQLYIISVIYEDRCDPLAFILMEKKTYRSYNLIFGKLKLLFPNCEISNFMTDYEAATRKALKRQFPNARISGCYFHYVKAINKASRRFGISKDCKFETAIQKVSALALLPNEFVCKGFQIINDENRDLKYSLRWGRFKKYWHRQWRNANISVFGLRHRTNNFAESMNKSLNVLTKVKGPNIWILIDHLKTLEMDKADELGQHSQGIMFTTLKPQKYEIKRLNEKIEKATEVFRKGCDVAKFLRNVTAGDKLEDFFPEAIYLDEIDDYNSYEDSGFDGNDEEEEDFIPNDFDPISNFYRQQTVAVKRKAEKEEEPQNYKKRRLVSSENK